MTDLLVVVGARPNFMKAASVLPAARAVGLETVLPCHYITLDGDKDVAEYMKHHRAAKARGEQIADPYLLRAGDWIEFDAAGKVMKPAKAA